MDVQKVTDNKKAYIGLLLLAGKQEGMIDKYLERGKIFVLRNDGIKAEYIIAEESEGIYELKNITVMPNY